MDTSGSDSLTHRPSLRNAVQNRLEEAILRGELKDGQQLVETEIAQWLGVSRGLVREAFRELEKTGIVTHNPYRGTFVRSLTAKRVHELYTLRNKLEEFAIELAIQRITDEDIDELEQNIDKMRRLAEKNNLPGLLDADFQFHNKLYAISDHDMLIDHLNSLSRQSYLFIMLTKVVYTLYPTLQDLAESHEDLLEAVRQRDTERAKAEVRKHISVINERIANVMQKEDFHPL